MPPYEDDFMSDHDNDSLGVPSSTDESEASRKRSRLSIHNESEDEKYNDSDNDSNKPIKQKKKKKKKKRKQPESEHYDNEDLEEEGDDSVKVTVKTIPLSNLEQAVYAHIEKEFIKNPKWCLFCSYTQTSAQKQAYPILQKLELFLYNNFRTTEPLQLCILAQNLYNKYVRGHLVKPKEMRKGDDDYIKRPMSVVMFFEHVTMHAPTQSVIQTRVLRVMLEAFTTLNESGMAHENKNTPSGKSLRPGACKDLVTLTKELLPLSAKLEAVAK